MASLFPKRLTCFYCGCRSPHANKDPVRKWRCTHCDAVNYLDERGEITDPPASETNPDVYGPGASSPPFEAVDFKATGLFCSECVRNQHLFTTMLASYLPPLDDPDYKEYERAYPEYRRNLEERYPQVCVDCEPRVRERIRQSGYEAKSDHLRRMMDRSKAGRAASQARKRNWRSWLIFVGAIMYWASVIGQVAWDIMGALDTGEHELYDPDQPLPVSSLDSCVFDTLRIRHLPSHCSTDLSPLAGLSLLAGILSIWWNPKLRAKVEGRSGRLIGLGDYYKVQLIVLVARCVFWAVLRDPSLSGLQDDIPPTLHLFMIALTFLSVLISRRIIKYDMRPLVAWSEVSPSTTPIRKAEPPSSLPPRKQDSSSFGAKRTPPRFPLEKLVSPRRELEGEPAIPTPPPEVDGMDWTPSVQHNIRPTVSVHQRNERSVLDGPLPFHGSLPAAPQPPSWILRNKPTPKPIEQVVEPNPFHRTPTQCPGPWQQSPAPQEPAFAPPKFFPPSDHVASTGLESLFDQTFTIRSPEEEGGNLGRRPKQASYPRTDVQDYLLFQYVRLGLLLTSIAAWGLSQGGYISVPGNYIEVISLGSASLIAGFGLLEVLKQPMVHWNGMEIMVYLAELVVPVHLGYNLPRASFEREYFDRYGKLLLIFMASQEVLGLLFFYRTATVAGQEEQPVRRLHQEQQQTQPAHPNRVDSNPIRKSRSPSESHASLSSLSLSSTAPGSSSLIQPSEPQFQQGFRPNEGFKDHSFSLESLKSADSDDSYGSGDSDTETTMTTATTATNSTIRNIRYGGNFVGIDSLYSPNRTELGPRIGGLSLEDKPARTTRSQTQQRLRGNAPGSGMGTGSNRYAARRVK